jgi:hypothetical protein
MVEGEKFIATLRQRYIEHNYEYIDKRPNLNYRCNSNLVFWSGEGGIRTLDSSLPTMTV